ncbi:flavodoxin domain-containing protein [Kribbella sp. NBC_01510]|uniref:flavodoxin family protein n=1 Tax=Kribbella sp. NBC_01510 TaxID=2903581 RepID=UPI00386EE4C0
MADQLRALVVYESMFGNTEQVARAIGAGLRETMAVVLCAVDDAPAHVPADVDLLVVGGPTHAFGMSRPTTRSDAAGHGRLIMSPEAGIREWLDQLPDVQGLCAAATFDTRMTKVRWMPGSAAHGAAKLLHERGYPLLLKPTSFCVVDTFGPLMDDQLLRAHEWGSDLAKELLAGTRPGMTQASGQLDARDNGLPTASSARPS